VSDTWVLLREFFRAPTRVATVTASSEALVAEMVRPFPRREDPVIVELGAGTGRVTDGIQRRLRGRGRHIAIEINPLLAARLAERHPPVTVVCADAAALPHILAARGVPRVDLVASLLPWAAYRNASIQRLVAEVLAPDGAFTQVVLTSLRWMGPARRQDRETRATFPEVHLTPTVWRNLPPARVRVARLRVCSP
jgi:phosphatidylethanolamine/phosphatidyl-N-methylethanolamine N-methyltransferase